VADLAALERTAAEVKPATVPRWSPLQPPSVDQTMRVWLVEDDAALGRLLHSQLEAFY
jgi:hypothetical protein